jgi:hypothetical protein
MVPLNVENPGRDRLHAISVLLVDDHEDTLEIFGS